MITGFQDVSTYAVFLHGCEVPFRLGLVNVIRDEVLAGLLVRVVDDRSLLARHVQVR
jgi:hypothetical protein